jgi:hypothetical protein
VAVQYYIQVRLLITLVEIVIAIIVVAAVVVMTSAAYVRSRAGRRRMRRPTLMEFPGVTGQPE